jgi:hypothetical protein
MKLRTLLPVTLAALSSFALAAPAGVRVHGDPLQWHRLSLDVTGPEASETAEPNPFTDHRLDVTFTHPASGTTLTVPGYYAADGDAAESSAESGNLWRVHFRAPATGIWNYQVSFRSGPGVATSDQAAPGKGGTFADGATGTFEIAASDKKAPDFRARGRLAYVGKHHLRFTGDHSYFLKAGADSPENLLAYADFDGPFKDDGIYDHFIKNWEPHVKHWQQGNPVWQETKGKGLIGALNHLAEKGLNSVSFLTLNIEGDDRNVFPYLHTKERLRFDCSRLAQWDIVFTHAQRLGLHLHFKTQESENEMLLDHGDLGPQRKLYYRELVARFGDHLVLNWNLGEENGKWGDRKMKPKYQSTAQRQAMARWFEQNDPWKSHIVIHNGQAPDDLLGNASALTGFSLQTHKADFSHVFPATLHWINASVKAGKPWVVACDEPGDHEHSLRPAGDEGQSWNDGRINALWGNLMAGGAGCEFYFGYKHAHSDLTCQDFTTRDGFWDFCRHALHFFRDHSIPFHEMKNRNDLVADGHRCLSRPGRLHLVQLPRGGPAILDLSKESGTWQVRWFDPRRGGDLQTGSIPTVQAGARSDLGPPPSQSDLDWIVLVTREK